MANLHFSATYKEARAKLLELVPETRTAHTIYANPKTGALGEELVTDVILLGRPDAEKTLIICSGTHGIEGFCGSAIQHQLFSDGFEVPEDINILIVHALNPYGFSYLRRVNEDNVDLNRNFIDFTKPLPRNNGYDDFSPYLNPTDLNSETLDELVAKINALRSETDYLTFMKSVSGGQYHLPKGVQFGGQEPSWTRQTLEKIWDDYLGASKVVMQIDIHSGLGSSGIGMLMMAANPDEPHKELTGKWFGPMMVTPRPFSEDQVVLGGYMNQGLEDYYANQDKYIIPMTLEFGSHPEEYVLKVLIEDNWLHNFGDFQSDYGQDIKRRIKEAFCPDSRDWETQILSRGQDVISTAMKELNNLELSDVIK